VLASLVADGAPAIVPRNGSATVLLRIHVETGRLPIVVLQDPNAPQHAP
jgi:hypothetical protein